LLASALIAAAVAWATPASASDDALEVMGIGGVVALALGDVAFFGYAVANTAANQPPDRNVSIAQAVYTAPQSLGFQIGMAALPGERDGSEILAGVAPIGMVVNTLFAHGVWLAARPNHDLREAFAGSSVMGVNAGWTSVVLGYAIEPDMDMEALSPAIVVTSALGLGVSIPYAVLRPGFRTGWIGNAVWSGGLFTYGVAAAFGAWTPEEDADPLGWVDSLRFGPVAVVPPGDSPAGAMGVVGRW
jgi:hypothetical protein